MTEPLRTIAPPVVQPLLPPFFDAPAIEESRATCGDCAMCKKPDQTAVPGAEYFIPDAKCCTYEPTLPNFLAGAILDDDAAELAEGRARIRAKIAGRNLVTPAWIAASRKFRLLLDAARTTSFGRTTKLLCPYFDAGRCTIWRHRESVCSTFFCKHVGGAYGHSFWRALKAFLGHTETALARWAARTVDPELPETELPRLPLTIEDVEDRPPDDATYASWWGRWVGREEAFYGECLARVRALDRAAFEAIVLADDRGRSALETLRLAYDRATKPVLAERLVLADDLRPARSGDGVVVVPYSSYDAQHLSESLYEVLKMLRAEETVSDFVDRIRREREVDVPRDLLLHLQMLGIVVPPDAEA
jgi:Fe-S-cluster containining protein